MQDKWDEVLAAVLMAAVAVFVTAGLLRDRRRRRRVARLLGSRDPLDAVTFGRTYFGDSPAKAAIAAAVRDVLSGNLKQRLDGLRPDDRLDEDLGAELLANPHLLGEIEQALALGAVTPVSDWDEYRKFVAGIRTFRDLVESAALRQNASAGTA